MKKLLELIGNTPLVLLEKVNPNPNVKVYAKLEGCNPGGSVKDRIALSMFTKAVERGDIKPGTKLIEPTSGNTGIALAMIAAAFGYQIELVMPENATKERIQVMEAFGAKVTLTPKEQSIEGSIDYARAKAAKEGLFIFNQFDNPDNVLAHYTGTGPEIYRDTNGTVTHFVSSMGTTGTVSGAGRYLKEQNKNIKILGVHPVEGVSIPGLKRWAPDSRPKIYDAAQVDDILDVTKEEAVDAARQVAAKDGVFVGMSAGGAIAAALRLSKQLTSGVVVVIVPDRGERYLSIDLFKK